MWYLNRRWLLVAIIASLGVGALIFATHWRRPIAPIAPSAPAPDPVSWHTVDSRLEQLGADARARLHPYFARARVTYPGRELILLGLKAERRLDVYVQGADSVVSFIRSYPIQAASGTLGPKLRQGDRQVPEGLYKVESFNPNSRFHLALRVGYPNRDDHRRALADGRTTLGGDIMIHGGDASIGCLAMGDPAIEELFVLAADVGRPHIRIILAPQDLRVRPAVVLPTGTPDWTDQLYAELRHALDALPLPAGRGAPRRARAIW
jgi:L,D-transpeptidase-like protein